ncbi:hypothetical protein GCM10017562_62700 [Streptomyces roseofulvus]
MHGRDRGNAQGVPLAVPHDHPMVEPLIPAGLAQLTRPGSSTHEQPPTQSVSVAASTAGRRRPGESAATTAGGFRSCPAAVLESQYSVLH